MPAAVTCPVKKRPKTWAASITARYPAMFAIELRTSIDCAREIRGTASRASTVTPRAASCSSRSGRWAGEIRATSVAPLRSLAISSVDGALTFSTTSASQASPMSAPACA